MPKGSMWDSAEFPNFSSSVEYDFKETDSGYLISIVPNHEWLDSGDRVCHITIDPSINESIITGIEDTRNVNVAPDNNYSSSTALIVGRTPYSNQQEYWKSYIKCKNLPNLSRGEIVTKS